MNKRITGWYIAAAVAELLAAGSGTFIFIGGMVVKSPESFLYASMFELMFGAGLWLPLFAAFVGVCVETRRKKIIAMPIAVGIPLIFALNGILFFRTSSVFAGFAGIQREFFYMGCAAVSFILLITVVIRAVIIKKDKYAEFLAAPKALFTKNAGLWITIISVLTAICLIYSVTGFFS